MTEVYASEPHAVEWKPIPYSNGIACVACGITAYSESEAFLHDKDFFRRA